MANKSLDIIKLQDICFLGRGSYAQVRKAKYNNQIVAVKIFDQKQDSKSEAEYIKEVGELKRTSHENIIKLIAFGKWQEKNDVFNCMVIELADVGSLHHVLYETNYAYTLGHAISWLKQCANAINYLHSRTPKPTIHRDLKPLNLLLMNGGTLLKVCDFGTACNLKTIMTNNKGSPCWISPEQLTEDNYNEKCDVYSYSIIAWEIISRQKPYFHLSDPNSAQIMFGVIKGTYRPKKIANCPKTLELLFDRGMDGNPNKRPSMQFIANLMEKLDILINKEPIKPICDSKIDSDVNLNQPKKSDSTFSYSNVDQRNSVTFSSFESIQSCKSAYETVIKPQKSITSTKLSTEMLNKENIDFEYDDSDNQTQYLVRNQQRYSFNNKQYESLSEIKKDPTKFHRRSKSYGNDFAINKNSIEELNKSEQDNLKKEQISKELIKRVETMLYDPIEPISNEYNSIEIFNKHHKLIKEDENLQKKINGLEQQIEQLNSTIKNIDLYNHLIKQKNLLLNENARLKQQLID